MSKARVLIFSAGETNSVELHDALAHNVNIEVYGASSVDRHGPYIFKNYCGDLPYIHSSNFIDRLNDLILRWEIDYIFPSHDDIALFLAKNRHLIKAKVIASTYETARVCRDKKLIYEMFKDFDFCPNVYSSMEKIPVFIKPRNGQGGQGTVLVNTPNDVPAGINLEEYVITEYLPGDELSVDCITDANGVLRGCYPRRRNRVLAGVCISGTTMKANSEILDIADKINRRLSFLGLWFFQIKKDQNGKYKLLEFATRCASTMCLTRARGINLPLLSVYCAMGKEISICENPYTVQVDRTFISRYFIDYEFDSVYLDYDDTLIEGNDVCLSVIRFLYQCRNTGKHVTLLTKHEAYYTDTIDQNLERHAISKQLFDEVIILSALDRKANYILASKSIFIDNAYSERKDVHDTLGIPVFDIEGIETLLDWRS